MIMKEYKTSITQKLSGYAHEAYSAIRNLFRDDKELLYLSGNPSSSRNAHYGMNNDRGRKPEYGTFEIPPGTGYPELKPVGSRI